MLDIKMLAVDPTIFPSVPAFLAELEQSVADVALYLLLPQRLEETSVSERNVPCNPKCKGCTLSFQKRVGRRADQGFVYKSSMRISGSRVLVQKITFCFLDTSAVASAVAALTVSATEKDALLGVRIDPDFVPVRI
jgi:hypothetical protein